MSYRRVLRELDRRGLLLLSDSSLPSVVGIVVGSPVRGSWWAHERGRDIWGVLKRLDSDPDVLVTRLVSGKVTYVHRRLWRPFLTVATSKERWQTEGLTAAAKALWAAVSKTGEVRMDRYGRGETNRRAAKEVERRLLAYSDEIHTERGTHAKVLATWPRCPKLRGERFTPYDGPTARRELEAAVRDLGAQGGSAELPWRKII